MQTCYLDICIQTDSDSLDVKKKKKQTNATFRINYGNIVSGV